MAMAQGHPLEPQVCSVEERQRISPLARRLAREHDIDLNAIAGTGIGGRVRKEDILAYVAQQRQRLHRRGPIYCAASRPADEPAYNSPARQRP